jgi:cyclopropane-fatty-acyl-phospholipid synthase
MDKNWRSQAAASVLGRIFRDVPFGFAARLWDGTQVLLGSPPHPFTLVFRTAAIFRSLMLRPNTRRFAEAFVDGDLDVEGDLFAALRLGNRVDALRLGLRDRMAIVVRVLPL